MSAFLYNVRSVVEDPEILTLPRGPDVLFVEEFIVMVDSGVILIPLVLVDRTTLTWARPCSATGLTSIGAVTR